MVPRTGPRMCNWPPEDDKVRNPMRLPFFYGWIVVAVTFVTMAIGVNARTSFSLLFPPIIDEFGWERGVTAGAFSFGFLASGVASPLIGRMMDRFGPRAVMELGIALMGGGLLLAPLTTQPWHLYLTLGVMVGAGSVCLGYSGQSLFLPNWFNRRRGLALGLAFTGVGIGSITLLPWAQHMIEQTGWRTACTAISAHCISGTRCRFTRPNTFWTSALVRASRSGRWAWSACSVFPARSCSDPSPTGWSANGYGTRAASALRSAMRH